MHPSSHGSLLHCMLVGERRSPNLSLLHIWRALCFFAKAYLLQNTGLLSFAGTVHLRI